MVLSSLKQKFSTRKSHRVLFLGYPGKTSFLYYEVLQKKVPTIPTIGFNVEDIRLNDQHTLNVWDVGGCDKILPLIRHYYEDTKAIVFFVSTRTRGDLDFSLWVLEELVKSEHALPLVPLVLFLTHRDLPQEQTMCLIEAKSAILERLGDQLAKYCYTIIPGCSFTSLGHRQVMAWLEYQLVHQYAPDRTKSVQPVRSTGDGAINPMQAADIGSLDTIAVPRSPSDDLDDETLLARTEDYTLPIWDHKTHLRLAFLVLTRDGRQRAVAEIFRLIKNFIDNSDRTRKTFHLTMTYFWIQMIHFAIVDLQSKLKCAPSFSQLLQAHQELLDGGLFRQYYSDELMLHSAEARVVFIPPDRKPLPSVVPIVN